MNKEELLNIKGGGWKSIGIFAGIIIFAIGFIDGFINPIKCN
jgi:lactobin A/cerein 7B family class IIb bacteriocin